MSVCLVLPEPKEFTPVAKLLAHAAKQVACTNLGQCRATEFVQELVRLHYVNTVAVKPIPGLFFQFVGVDADHNELLPSRSSPNSNNSNRLTLKMFFGHHCATTNEVLVAGMRVTVHGVVGCEHSQAKAVIAALIVVNGEVRILVAGPEPPTFRRIPAQVGASEMDGWQQGCWGS